MTVGREGQTSARRIALIDLGRATASGARRRLSSMVDVIEALGDDPVVISIFPNHALRRRHTWRLLPSVLRGSAVPESLAWSPRSVRRELDRAAPDIAIAITARAYHPALLGPWRFYIDFVDRMSVNYRARSRLTSRTHEQAFYRALADRHRRFEGGSRSLVDGAFAAGRADAAALDAAWWPITLDPHLSPPARRTVDGSTDTDLVFVGTLDYLPNVAAVRELDRLWPALHRRVPGVRVTVAGARPTPEVTSIAQANGWRLVANFTQLSDVLTQARLSVSPLTEATGIQIKALDAAAFGVPQLVSPAVASGLDPDFPLVSCRTDSEWVQQIARYLEHPESARALGQQSMQHVLRHYSPRAVADLIRPVLSPDETAGR